MLTEFIKLAMSQSKPQMRIHLWHTDLSTIKGGKKKPFYHLQLFCKLLKERLHTHMTFTFILGKYYKEKWVKLIGHAVPKISHMQGQLPWITVTLLFMSVTNDHPYSLSMCQHTSEGLIINSFCNTVFRKVRLSLCPCLHSNKWNASSRRHLLSSFQKELNTEISEGTLWSTFYCMEPHKKTSNIGKKVTILEGIFLWAVCFWVYVLMTFLEDKL